MMEIVEVKDKKDARMFLRVPHLLYRNDPAWVSPLHQDVERVFDPAFNRHFRGGEAKRWVLMDGEKPVGRFAAFYNANDSSEGKSGGAGFFECVNNKEAAAMLFKTAEDWLLSKGMKGYDAPINFGERDKFWGLLVSGFDRPAYQDNYNPPYYREFFEDTGFHKLIEQHTYRIKFKDFNYDRISRIAERTIKNQNVSFLPFNRKETDRFAADFVKIYNEAWQSRPDFVPNTVDRVKELIKSLLPVLKDDFIWFAYVKGEPAGFYINVPDINPLLKSFGGHFGMVERLILLLRIRLKQVKRSRGLVFGIVPAYQNFGLDAGLMISFYHTVQKNYPELEEAELSWAGDFNPRMLSLFKGIGANPAKIHLTYRKHFSDI